MNGRLGMTGNSIDRGDSAVYKGLGMAYVKQPAKAVGDSLGPVLSRYNPDKVASLTRKSNKFFAQHHANGKQGPYANLGLRAQKLAGNINQRVGTPHSWEINKGLMSVLRGKPKIIPLPERPIPKFAVKGGWRDARLDAREEAASDRGRFRAGLSKVDTTMDEHEAGRLAGKYDTRGPLPKGLDRATKMKAYEARYIASGGKKGEKWKRHADMAERGRNIGLAGATTSAAAILALRGKHTGPALRKIKITPHRAEAVGLGSAVAGGTSELYGEHARHRRASYQNSPAGVAGSALTRMQNYTPGVKR